MRREQRDESSIFVEYLCVEVGGRMPKFDFLCRNYFLSSVAADGTDGNGLQFEKIRLNFSNSFSVLTLNRY